jgi:hypothetical protein
MFPKHTNSRLDMAQEIPSFQICNLASEIPFMHTSKRVISVTRNTHGPGNTRIGLLDSAFWI